MLPWFPVGFRPPAFACWASCSRRGVPLSSRSAYQAAPGPRRGFHVPHIRATTGLGARFTPETQAVLSRPARSLRPPLAPSSRGQALSPRSGIPSPEAVRYGASSRVHSRSPARPSPSPDRSLDGTGAVGLLLGLRTPTGKTRRARQGGGRASSTRPELYDRHRRTSHPYALLQRATSCRTTGADMCQFPVRGAPWLPGRGEAWGDARVRRKTQPGWVAAGQRLPHGRPGPALPRPRPGLVRPTPPRGAHPPASRSTATRSDTPSSSTPPPSKRSRTQPGSVPRPLSPAVLGVIHGSVRAT